MKFPAATCADDHLCIELARHPTLAAAPRPRWHADPVRSHAGGSDARSSRARDPEIAPGIAGVHVVIVSGRPRALVEPLRAALDGIWWVAEHGSWRCVDTASGSAPVRRPRSPSSLALFAHFTLRTPGVRLEAKSESLCVHWRLVPPAPQGRPDRRVRARVRGVARDASRVRAPRRRRDARGAAPLRRTRARAVALGARAHARTRASSRSATTAPTRTCSRRCAMTNSRSASVQLGRGRAVGCPIRRRCGRSSRGCIDAARPAEAAPFPSARGPARAAPDDDPAARRLEPDPARAGGSPAPGRRPRLGARASAARRTKVCGSAGVAGNGGRERASTRRRGRDSRARLVRVSPGLARALLRWLLQPRAVAAVPRLPRARPLRRRGLARVRRSERRVRPPRVRPRRVGRHGLDARLPPAARRPRHCGAAASAGRSGCSSTSRFRRLTSSTRCRGRDEILDRDARLRLGRLPHRAVGRELPGVRPCTRTADESCPTSRCSRSASTRRCSLRHTTGRSRHRRVCASALGARKLDPRCRSPRLLQGHPRAARGVRAPARACPEWRGQVSFVQVSVPSRADVPEYAELRHARREAGRAHQRPVRRGRLGAGPLPLSVVRPSMCSRSSIGSPTSRSSRRCATGMNLVAKEFVAAQDADDPGVLVLSRFAGARPSSVTARS